MTAETDQLERNYSAFVAKLPELLTAHRGEHVLMHDGEVVDFFDTEKDAHTAGGRLFGKMHSVQEVIDRSADLSLVTADNRHEADQAVRDILYMYHLLVADKGFTVDVNYGSFDPWRYVDARVEEPEDWWTDLDLNLLRQGSGVAFLCILCDYREQRHPTDPVWPSFSSIRKALEDGRLRHLPVIEDAVRSGLANGSDFFVRCRRVYDSCVLAYLERLARSGTPPPVPLAR